MSKKAIAGIFVLVCGIISLAFSSFIFENVPAGKICVIQSPLSGNLNIHTDPGVKLQLFGKVTYYPKSDIFNFDNEKTRGIKIAFNDSGEALIPGSIRYDYPLEPDLIRKLHMTFSSHEAVVHGLIKPTIERSVLLTGPLMSSIDAFMARKADLPMMIEDQARNGLYKVKTYERRIIDETTQEEKTVKIAEPIKDESSPNGFARQESSVTAKYGIILSNFAPVNIIPSEAVKERITNLFNMYSEIEVSTLNVRKQEQERKSENERLLKELTIKEGTAKAISAEQKEIAEREKIVAVTQAEKNKEVAIKEAEQKKAVAELEKQTAALYKDAQTLRGEGDAAYKKAVMTADGALTQKLETYKEVQRYWADSFAQRKGNIVPQIVTGGSASGGNGVSDFMNILTVQALKDLQLDLKVPTK